MSDQIQRLRRARRAAWARDERARWKYGVLGQNDSASSAKSNQQDYMWVRMDGGTLTQVYNAGGVDDRVGLPVRMRDDGGRLIIEGINTNGLLAGDTNAPSKVYSVNDVGPDSHGNVTLSIPEVLADLGDVNDAAPASGDVVQFSDFDNLFHFVPVNALGLTLPDLNGVTITAPTNGDVLTYSAGDWINSPTTVPVKATGAEIDTGTDDAKFATPKAIEDSSYIKAAYADAKVTDAIADGATTVAPSQNAVFDALALKIATSVLDTDVTLAANSDAKIPSQKAIKTYVDAIAQGLDIKGSVRVATTANITLSGTQTIDGVAVIAGDRVLVKDQTLGANNGIYVAAAGAWTRATDADTSAKVTAGMFTFVSEGTVNGDNGFALTTNDPIVLATTVLAFTQVSGAGQIVAGNALTKTGNQLDWVPDGATLEVASDQGRVKDKGVTYAKIQDVSATDKLLGRATAGAGIVEEIALTAFARTLIDDINAAAVIATLGLTALYMDLTTNQTAAGNKTFSAPATFSNTTQLVERIRLSGQEFFQAAHTDTDGIALLLGFNRTNNRQLWFADSARMAVNTSNPVFRLTLATIPIMSAIATDGATFLPFGIFGSVIGINTTAPNANTMGIQAGTSTNDAAVGGVLYVDSGSHANSGSGETDLATYTVPADTLAVNNQSLVFEAWGTITNSSNNKTVKVKFGTDSWTIININLTLSSWKIRGRIIRTGAATQDVVIEGIFTNAAGTPVIISTATRTLSSSNVLKLTGQGGASTEISQEGFVVKWEDANV